MLFAIDIDHTIATYQGTDALGAYLRACGIPLSLHWRKDHYPLLLSHEALLQDPLYAGWYKEHGEPKEDIKKLLHEGQYSPVLQERAVPIPGAVEALHQLVAEGARLVYITNRKNITWDVTSSWLATHGFPCHERLHCCGDEEGQISKMRYACSYLHEGEHVIFIDDAARYFEHVLWKIAKEDHAFLRAYAERLAAIEIGQNRVIPCEHIHPVMPIASMLKWEQLDDRVQILLPFIGAKPHILYQFFDTHFEPVALRRRPNPKLPKDAFEQQMRRIRETAATNSQYRATQSST